MKWEKTDNKFIIYLDDTIENKDCICQICKKKHIAKEQDNRKIAFEKVCKFLDVNPLNVCLSCRSSLLSSIEHNYLSFNREGLKIKQMLSTIDIVVEQYMNNIDDDIHEEWNELFGILMFRERTEHIYDVLIKDEKYIEYVAVNGLRKIIDKKIKGK